MDRDKTTLLRGLNLQDIIPDDPPSYIEEATVGWDGEDTYYDLGTSENEESGQTLVRVQLFRGKPPHITKKNGVGQGYRLLCRIGLTPFRVPAKGTPVLVAFPGGNWQTPGNPVIFAVVANSPVQQFDAKRVVYDFGPDVEVVHRAKCHTFQSYETTPQYVSIGTPRAPGATPAIRIFDETGSGIVVSQGKIRIAVTDNGSPPKITKFLSMSDADGIDVMNTDGGSIKSSIFVKNDGDVWIGGANSRLFTRGVYLGTAATALTPVLIGNPASPTPSAVVFGSPT